MVSISENEYSLKVSNIEKLVPFCFENGKAFKYKCWVGNKKEFAIRYLIIFFSVICLWLSGCTTKHENILPINIDDVFPIVNWQVIGPFSFDTLQQKTNTSFDNRDLDLFGINEDSVKYETLKLLTNTKLKPLKLITENGKVELRRLIKGKIEDKSNFYLFTTIYSSQNRQVVFIVDGSRNYKLWINGQQILNISNKLNNNKVGDRFVSQILKKGENLIFAKVGRGENMISWEMILGVTTIQKAKDIFVKNYYSDFINNPIVGDSLIAYLGPLNNAKFIISDNAGNKIYEKEIFSYSYIGNNSKLNISKIKNDSFYSLSLIFQKDTLKEVFYKGNYSLLVKELGRKLNLIGSRNRDLVAGFKRIQYLDTLIIQNNSANEVRYYNKNRVFWAYSLYIAIKRKNEEKIAGTHIKTFTSENSNNENYFLLHVGRKTLSKGKIPIVLIMPYSFLDTVSFVKSWYIGNLDQIEMDCRMAEADGFALVWLNMGGEKFYQEKYIEDMKEVIKTIDKEYGIDFLNIYAIGDCIGGGRAILFAEKKPDLFSGIATFGPVTLTGTNNNMPINFVSNLYNVPIFIQHGETDKISPIENSLRFMEEAQKEGFFPKFIRTKYGHLEFCKDYRRPGFNFFDSLKSIRKHTYIVPNTVKFCAFDTTNASAYWIKINEIEKMQKAEISATIDSTNKKLHLKCKHIKCYTINLDIIKMKNKQISIYTNGVLSFKGTTTKSEIKINL